MMVEIFSYVEKLLMWNETGCMRYYYDLLSEHKGSWIWSGRQFLKETAINTEGFFVCIILLSRRIFEIKPETVPQPFEAVI